MSNPCIEEVQYGMVGVSYRGCKSSVESPTVTLVYFLFCRMPSRLSWLELTKLLFLSLSLSLSGCEAEVPLSSGWGYGEAGRTGEEDRQSCGGVQALLGGPQVGQTGQLTVHGGRGGRNGKVFWSKSGPKWRTEKYKLYLGLVLLPQILGSVFQHVLIPEWFEWIQVFALPALIALSLQDKYTILAIKWQLRQMIIFCSSIAQMATKSFYFWCRRWKCYFLNWCLWLYSCSVFSYAWPGYCLMCF